MKLHNIFSNELMFVIIFFSVSTMIGNLRNMATDMGTEVENQNRQLDRINIKVLFTRVFVKVGTRKFCAKDMQYHYQTFFNGQILHHIK